MEQSKCNGDNLLQIFGKLNIQLGSLSPNVVRAWFDTDCNDMQNFLEWMCTSLTEDNLLNPQEVTECLNIDMLTEEKVEEQVAMIERQYGDVFDVESNELEVELLKDEKEMYIQDLGHLDDLIQLNEHTLTNSCNKFSKLREEATNTKVHMEEAERNCMELAEKVDNASQKLYSQTQRYGEYLYNYEFAATPIFVNNRKVLGCEEDLNHLSPYLKLVLQKEYQNIPYTVSPHNSIIMNSSDKSDIKINKIRNRIYNATRNCLMQRFEEEQMRAVLIFVENYGVNSSSAPIDCDHLRTNIACKKERVLMMTRLVESELSKQADYHVSQSKLRQAKKELEAQQFKLECFTKLQEQVEKVLIWMALIRSLYTEEQNDILSSEKFIKEIASYITENLHFCEIRTDSMSKIISEFKLYNQQPVENKVKLVRELANLITGKEDACLAEALSQKEELSSGLSSVKRQILHGDIEAFKRQTKALEGAIDTMQNFLTSGPTLRIVTVPPKLFAAFKEADMVLENQDASMKGALKVLSNAKSLLSKNKWLKQRRHLWMHYLNDPDKLRSVMQAIEEEFNKLLKE